MQQVRHLPGEPGIWVLVIGDLMVFGLLFVLFVSSRAQNLELYRESQGALGQGFGALNTLLMLSSSLCVALGVRAFRIGETRRTPVLILGAFTCGAAFCVVKCFEWGAKFAAGITLASSEFFMYYFVLTGIHLLHVLIGLGVLLFMARYARKHAGTPEKIGALESGASFWHVVDVLWIVIFALLYLLP